MQLEHNQAAALNNTTKPLTFALFCDKLLVPIQKQKGKMMLNSLHHTKGDFDPLIVLIIFGFIGVFSAVVFTAKKLFPEYLENQKLIMGEKNY